MSEPTDGEKDEPTLRQKLHAATGDRDAEAQALAEEADVDVDDAKVAVQKAHGESIEGSDPDKDVATPADAREVAEGE